MSDRDFIVRIGQEELGQILNLKEKLDHQGQLWDYVCRYQALGWDLAVISAEGNELDVNWEQPQEAWWRQLEDLGLDGGQVNLAIRTGRPSGLLVLEVNKGGGALALDLLGDWQSLCVAELGNCREQHYYALARDSQAPPSFFLAQEVLIYSEGGLILAPPSIEPEVQEPWHWRTPPWEQPPPAPNPAVWQFLREQLAPAGLATWELPAWEEIYRIIAPHEPVTKALLMPPKDMEDYYDDILQAALAEGLRDPRLLLGLLWHAPHGDASSNASRWKYLQELLAQGSPRAAVGSALPALSPNLPLTRERFVDLKPEDPPGLFGQSVSGQFFQVLATLGEKVITESCRNEALLSGLEAQAAELERLAAEIEQCLSPASRGAADSPPAATPLVGRDSLELPWLTAMKLQHQNGPQLQEVKASVRDFFSQNPDLAEKRDRAQMVLFSLRNYVSINPDYAGLSFRDKLFKAGQMARDFLGQPAKA